MQIDTDKMSERQKANLALALQRYNEKKLISSDSPPVLYIELTQNCFGQCVFCKNKVYNDPAYNMKDEIFDILLKEYVPYAVLVDLRGWGESLTLPNFDEYVDKVARAGPKIRITTTLGTASGKTLQSILDNDVYVSVSFDFAEKELYQSMRKGLNYDTVIKNLEFLTDGMRKKGTLENIRFSIAPLQKANLNQVEKIILIARRYGIKEILFSQLVAGGINFNLLKYHRKKTIETLKRAIKLARETGIRLQLARSPFEELYIQEKAFDLCCHPWLYAFVNYKGGVLFCDHMLGAAFVKYAIGDITDSKAAVWNGEKAQMQRLRHIQKNAKNLPSKCKICYRQGRYADHEHEIDKQFMKWLVREDDMEKRLEQKAV